MTSSKEHSEMKKLLEELIETMPKSMLDKILADIPFEIFDHDETKLRVEIGVRSSIMYLPLIGAFSDYMYAHQMEESTEDSIGPIAQSVTMADFMDWIESTATASKTFVEETKASDHDCDKCKAAEECPIRDIMDWVRKTEFHFGEMDIEKFISGDGEKPQPKNPKSKRDLERTKTWAKKILRDIDIELGHVIGRIEKLAESRIGTGADVQLLNIKIPSLSLVKLQAARLLRELEGESNE